MEKSLEIVAYNKVLELTPETLVALRGWLSSGAIQHRRYA
jgi:hypothetical protein